MDHRVAFSYALVADADQTRASAVARCLLEKRLTPVVVRDGQQARARLTTGDPPSLVITNLSLPLIDGFQVLRELRQRAGPDRAAAIAISGFSILSEVAERLRDELGIVRTLPAGAGGEQISEAVRQALGSLVPGDAALVPGDAALVASPADPQEDDARWQAAARSIALELKAPIAFIGRSGNEQTVRLHLNAAVSFDVGVPEGPENWWDTVVRDGRTCAIADVLREPDAVVRDLTRLVLRGFEAAPLVVGGRTAGAVILVHPEPLRETEGGIERLAKAAASLMPPPRTTAAASSDEAFAVDGRGRYVETLWRMALTDPLTGMNNRRGAEDALQREFGRSRRMNSALSVAMFDIDGFKSLNDRYGHAAGDAVLREVATVLRTAARASDLAARWGGEEFLVILPDVSLEGAVRFADRIRVRIEQLTFAQGFSVTISAGLAQYRLGEPVHAFLQRADEQLYRAKSEGRNRVASESSS